jgi:hypothetical protein
MQPLPATPGWQTTLLQVLPVVLTTVFGAAIGYILTTLAERRSNKRALEAEARAEQRAIENGKRAQERTKQAVRQQLLLVLESVRGRFEAARLHPQMDIADNDPATGVLFAKAFAHEVALALSSEEARDVQEAALRAHRIAASLVEQHQSVTITNQAKIAEKNRVIAEAATDAVHLLDRAITTLDGPLDRSRRSLEPPS